MTSRSGEQGPIRGLEPRPPNLAAQNLKLVPQHHQLDVLDIRATATPNEQAEQSPNRQVEKGEEHDRRSSQSPREKE
jgi:hypothetical protein